jgi:hypothetical protein
MDDPGMSGTAAGAAPAGEGPSLLQRMVGVFVSPARAFSGRIPPRAWILPLILLSLFQTGESFLLRDLTVERMKERLVQTDLPEEARQKALEGLEQQGSGPMQVVLSVVGGGIWIFLMAMLLPALFYWLGANFVCGGSARYWVVTSVVGLSNLILLLRSVLTVPLKLSRNSLEVFTSLALLPAGEPGSKLQNALNAVDLFEIWIAAVAAVGLALAAGIRRGQAMTVVFVVWGLWVVLRMGMAFALTDTMWGALLGF